MTHASDWEQVFAAEHDVDLRPRTTVRVGGIARDFVRPSSAACTASLLQALKQAGRRWRVLGGGSNLLVGDEPLSEVVIHPDRLDSCEIVGSSMILGAGHVLQRAVNHSTDYGLAGAHVLTGIPGQLGGALAMNAGGRYGEMATVVGWAEVALEDGALHRLEAADLQFGYRKGQLPLGAVVTRVCWNLKPTDEAKALKREAGRILKEKNAAQPTQAWNFGCMFKNPAGQSAGKLIEGVGLKGVQVGEARISPKHGNFIENLGTARAADILALIERAEALVLLREGVHLEREVRVWM
ncbi:MAG: UDP-N-acetylmuramate dehydrogenase [Planctomycetes bacterium]|nr:UDP-N-acetylmuramate dehydrogenase [Planctomycetota bacterium]